MSLKGIILDQIFIFNYLGFQTDYEYDENVHQ